VRVGQDALRHRHGQVGNAGLLDQRADVRVGLRVGGTFAQEDQRALGALQQLERALDGIGRRDLARRRIDHLDERPLAGLRVDRLREELRRQVEVDATRAARNRGADGACDADTDVLGVQYAEGRLRQWLGDGQLVHLLVITLLQIDDLALAGAADEDHREAVGRGIGQSGEAVEEARRGHREADARCLRHEAGDGRRVAGVLLMAERNHAHARGLRLAGEVGDRNAGQAEDRVDAVEFQGIDDQMKAVGQRCIGGDAGGRDLRFDGAHPGTSSRDRARRSPAPGCGAENLRSIGTLG
jgi:hypothetical protein